MPKTPRTHEPLHFIAIEGPIRVGKTTLADLLADRLHAKRVRDDEDNPFLESFYSESPERLSRRSFTSFCSVTSSGRHSTDRRKDEIIISDYIFEKDKIFAY